MTDELKPLTEEDLAALLEDANHVEQERAEDDGAPYEQYGKAKEIDQGWYVCLDPEKARRLVAEVRRLRAKLAECESSHVHVAFTESKPDRGPD